MSSSASDSEDFSVVYPSSAPSAYSNTSTRPSTSDDNYEESYGSNGSSAASSGSEEDYSIAGTFAGVDDEQWNMVKYAVMTLLLPMVGRMLGRNAAFAAMRYCKTARC